MVDHKESLVGGGYVRESAKGLVERLVECLVKARRRVWERV